MAISIVQLGTPRRRDEGLRIGTVRRPPRGVRKENYASEDWYDVWFPVLAPSAELMSAVKNDEISWAAFTKKYRAEMARPDAAHVLDLLAAMSHTTNFAVGCYCDDEERCHRSLMRALLVERGAVV